MEIIVGLPPIELFLKTVAIESHPRLKVNNRWFDMDQIRYTKRSSHMEICKNISNEIPLNTELSDKCKTSVVINKHFTLTIMNREEWMKAPKQVQPGE